MPKNTKLTRLRRRVEDAERKVEAAPPERRAHRQKILTQRRRLLTRAQNHAAGTGWSHTHKMKSNGRAHAADLVAARLHLRREP